RPQRQTNTVIERSITRCTLYIVAHKSWQHRFDIGGRDLDRQLAKNLALCIARARGDAQAHHRDIALVRVQERLSKLGRLAKTYGQQAASSRIERPGMPGFVGTIESFRPLQSRVGCEPD